MSRLVFTRKSAGGRCCFFKGKGGGRMTSTRGTTQTTGSHKNNVGVKETMSASTPTTQKSPIVMMENKKTPSNYQLTQQKENMDNFARKLGAVKVKQQNINFSL